MPYIPQDRRIPPEKRGYEAEHPGELNYAITRLCDLYIADMGLNYANINAVVGALECAKQEFYRRVAVPYEEGKRISNGDVYTVIPEPPPASWLPTPDTLA